MKFNKCNYKKAAMFGLDARIALAIFGALSVISGAALYSAIENAKVIKTVTELNEFAKAVDSFRVDTGVDLPAKGILGILMGQNLVESTITGAKTPYISFEKHTLVDYYLSKNGIRAGVYNRPGTTWGNDSHSDECLAAPCIIWVSFLNDYTLDFANKVDGYIDGTADIENGKARAYLNPGEKYNLYLEVGPALIQP